MEPTPPRVKATTEGSYRLNENHSVLYLESQEKSETDAAVPVHRLTEYTITIKEGVLTMVPKTENAGSTKYVYSRSGGAVRVIVIVFR